MTLPYASFLFAPGNVLGDAMLADQGSLDFYVDAPSGSIDLATEGDYSKCSTCVVVTEDFDLMSGTYGRFYYQLSGSVELGASTLPAISGSLHDVTLVEVTIDETTGVSTPVAGGACLHIADAPFAFDPAPAGWTCDPGAYADRFSCFCGPCGVSDPDCADMSLAIDGCYPGQSCVASACAGSPTGWTCAASKFNGGAGNGCDCGCGIHDPDCDLAGEIVSGCPAGSACNAMSACVPPTWTCGIDFFGAMDGCDCGCGAVDPDCSDATLASCDFCSDGGSCNSTNCVDPGCLIDPANNAVCL
jgi:hypothetical protein